MDDEVSTISGKNSDTAGLSPDSILRRNISSCIVSICVATCQRPIGLRRTLLSLARLTFNESSAPHIRIIVVDNDTRKEGLDVIAQLSGDYPWEIQAIYEPVRGISYARNALVRAAAGSDFIAFIDDDEYAEPQWLEELIYKAETTGAEAILGPVQYELETQPPPYLHSVFEESPIPDGMEVSVGDFRTSNLLILNRCLKDICGPFDPMFALTGGSDTFLGYQLKQRNKRFVWASKAIVHETVPGSRISFQRYLRRRYRDGMVYAMVQQRILGVTRGSLRVFYRGGGSITLSLFKCLLAIFPGTETFVKAIGLSFYGIGNIAGIFGHRYREYDHISGS